jgi:hypothetical protein
MSQRLYTQQGRDEAAAEAEQEKGLQPVLLVLGPAADCVEYCEPLRCMRGASPTARYAAVWQLRSCYTYSSCVVVIVLM